MPLINFCSIFTRTVLAAVVLLYASGRLASAAPTIYGITAIYDSGGASGTVTGSFTFDPSSAPSYCVGSPTSDCYWDLDGVGGFSTTGTYTVSTDANNNTTVQQTLWSAPNPDYTQEMYIAMSDYGVGNLGIVLFPAPYTNLEAAIVPTGTFTFPNGTGSFGYINIDGNYGLFTSLTITAETVPEPASIALLAFPLVGLLLVRHRSRLI